MSRWASGRARVAALFAAWRRPTRTPTRAISSRTPRNRLSCSRAGARSGSSAVAKWVKHPSSEIPSRRATSRARSGAASGRTPSRPMPVSTFRWTAAVRPRRAAAWLRARASSAPETDAVRSWATIPSASAGTRAEDEDGRGNARPPELHPFLHGRNAEGLGAGLEGGPGHLHGAVAVGVGLDDREEARRRPEEGADALHVGPQRIEVDLRPGGPKRPRDVPAGACHGGRDAGAHLRGPA